LELFFKNQGSNCEIMDCGLILEKPKAMAAAGRALVRGRSGFGIGARRSRGEAVAGGDAGAPFYRVGGGAGQPGDGGE
jgi:hypothetical protein